MTTSVTDMEILKEIPGYKAIMKAVLKTQIQLLIEQLSDHTGEESIVLTASVNDGSLSHLGSCTGKGFLDGRDEIKSQFLGYCLKSHHKRKTAEPAAPYQRSNVSNVPGPRSSLQQTAKRPRLHPVSLSRLTDESEVPDMNMPSDTSGDGMYTSTPVQSRSRSQRGSASDSSVGPPRTLSTDSRTNVKLEQSSDTLEGDSNVQPSDTGTDFMAAASLPSSIGLSHTQTSESVSQGQGEKGLSSIQAGHGEASQSPGIKVEPVAESELDLEITGIELGDSSSQMSSENWGQNVSGGAVGFGPGTADGSFEQTDNQSGYSFEYLDGSTYNTITVLEEPSRLKEFGCSYCDKMFLSKSHVRQHERIHTGERPYKCDKCEMAFNQRGTLNTHYRIHTGERPFKCEFCDKSFISRAPLNYHVKKNHGDESAIELGD